MKHLFKPETLKWVLTLLIIVLAVKLLWLAAEMTLLPTAGVNQAEEVGGKSLYYRVNLSPNKAVVPKKKKVARKPVGSIRDIELLAVYNAEDNTVVTVMYKHKTKVLGRGEAVNGFVLEGAGSNYATFSKNGKSYRVDLIKGRKSTGSGSIRPAVPSASSRTKAPSKAEGEIVDAGDHKIVDRSLLEHYAKNMDDIYKNIGITEVRKGGALKGFKITFVKRGTPFAKLGVRRGDIIKSINGQEINSYNAAFNVYKNIGNAENLTLVIQRGKEEMELEYEIN